MPAAQPHALQVDGHDPVPHVLRCVAGARVLWREYAGVVVEDVEATERLDRERDHGLHLHRLRHIGAYERRLSARGADGVDRGPARVLHRIGHDDLGTLGCEQLGTHPAEAAACARDQRDLPVEPPGHGELRSSAALRSSLVPMRPAAYRARVSEPACRGRPPEWPRQVDRR